MLPFKLQKYIFYFALFFLIFYIESIEIGSFSISQIWKIPLITYFAYYVFQKREKEIQPWAKVYYWLSLKCMINSGMFYFTLSNILDGIRFLFLPLIYDYFSNKQKLLKETQTLLLIIIQYFILSNIPFFLGLKSLSTGKDYGSFIAYTGLFQNQHAMSTIMSLCILVILYFYKQHFFTNIYSKSFNFCLLAIALYAMFLGFARTGWLMCVSGIVVLYFPKKHTTSQIVSFIAVCIALTIGFCYLMNNNKLFHDRITGVSLTTHKKIDIGSGRVDYMRNALELYKQGNIFEYFFGKSMEELKDYEYQKTHMRISSHNGFTNILVCNGIIGVALLLLFLIMLFVFIMKRKNSPTFQLALAMWFMNLSFQITQGGHLFHTDLIYALVFCILNTEYEVLDCADEIMA